MGSDWERKVRTHYTRDDRTLNINGYYLEMFGFPVNSSDFESGNSDSDSDSSGNDSDCVIISPSEFSYKNPNNRSLIVADSVATISSSIEISSRFTSDEFVSTFRQAIQVSGEGGENQVMIDPVAVGEFVTTVNKQEPHYFYMYIHVLQTLNLWLPFNSFECQILRVMNVAPCQLHPNSWAFLKAFQIACEGFPELMYDASGNRLFPFYWSSSPRLVKGTRASTLNEYEWDAVAALSRFHVMSSGELVARENKPQSLGEYMASMSTLSAQQRAALVLKARAQKAEAAIVAASADVMAQFVVEEGGVKGTKRKNQEESSRIPVEIPKKKKVTNVEEEEAKVEDEPLKSKRMPRGKRNFHQLMSFQPEVKNGKKSNLSANLWTKDFDSFTVVDESFQKYARTSSLSDLTFEDLRQATMDHHIQGTMLSYYLSTRQELHSIDSMNKMESADTSLSALEKEFAAAKSKFEEDLAAVKAGQEEVVKATVKVKDDEVVALKGRLKSLEGELDVAIKEKDKVTTQRDEASLNVEALAARIEKLELEGASQFDDGFIFALDQVKVTFLDVDVVRLGELDSVNQIVDGKIVPYVPLEIMEKSSKKHHSAPTRRSPRVNSSKLLSSKPKSSKKTSSSKIKSSKKPKRQIVEIESSESDKVDSNYVEDLRTYRPEDESWDSNPGNSQLTAEYKLTPGKEKNSPCNKEGLEPSLWRSHSCRSSSLRCGPRP
ncbi:hypothetical protein TSUD_404090 [Trifolium subterraneum]|uniref:Uncharacterized protein n=1 Tax=Trifolium subterraneum TaxID=3900 RepID=A0A2Z6PDQ2_TRISU|nr:hypothetical protein TSUD_404090 [Trifolium subterraneum]